jgi:hypothetical protein
MPQVSPGDLLKTVAVANAGADVVPGAAVAVTHGIAGARAREGARAGGGGCSPAELTGRIVRPDSTDYPSACLAWDELFVHHPLVIVFAQETQDVVNALAWARQNDVALRVRSGRHSLGGWSNVDNGVVIDVSELKSARIDAVSRIATVGAGLNQLEAVRSLAKENLGVTTGTEGSVGLSGATLGGGFGFLTRWLGMACDSLMGAEIVVPAGAKGAKAINVDLNNHPDLLFALRGAGNGNFGIVTSLTYKAAHLDHVAYLQATWDAPYPLHGIFDAFQRMAAFLPNGLGTQLEIRKPQLVLFGVLPNGSEAEVTQLLDPILSTGKPDVSVQVGNWGEIYAGFQVPTAADPAKWKFSSQFASRAFPKEAITAIGSFMKGAPTDESNYFVQPFGGAVTSSEPRGGAAFPHRDKLFYAEPGAGWGTRGDEESGKALTPVAEAWIAEFSRALRPYANGAYVNVPNIGMEDWAGAYWGGNLDRLREIKTRYDPDNVFQYEQSIAPASC